MGRWWPTAGFLGVSNFWEIIMSVLLLPLLAIFLILDVGPSWAYQEGHVSNGGTISGNLPSGWEAQTYGF
jgi:hypothetical protein